MRGNISLMIDAYKSLEFDAIKSFLLELSKTEKGKELILSLKMSSNKDKVKKNIDELDEMMNFISRYGSLPIQQSAYIERLIDIAKKSALLTPNDLNHVLSDIETSDKLLQTFNSHSEAFPLLSSYFNDIQDLSSLKKSIKRCITPSLTVSDNASPELKEIRAKIKTLETRLNSKVASLAFNYGSYLSDSNVTIRDGHFVLPVKTSMKSKVLGLVYDVSDSGNTTFIEPLEIVQLNNDITSYKLLENEEIRKILKELTALVLLQENEVVKNNNIIATLDFIFAEATYALNNDYKVASLSDKQEIDLVEAKHPLIDKNKVVSNDYHLDEDKRIVIISGPNAGGKTVSIKTVGLLTMMNQCGLALPVKEAKLGIVNNIYLDIGDSQSLSDNLSTFSGHMKNISDLLNVTGGKDLVLIDELGTGTDPKEGEIIGLTIVKEIEKKHSLAMISSHYSLLKEYAYSSEHIENASMLFDEDKLLPTYRYKYQAPGKSYGFEVAVRYGINKDALKETKEEFSSKDNDDFETLLSKLQKQIDENERLKRDLEAKQDNLDKKEKSLLNSESALLNRKEHLLDEVRNEKEQILSDLSKEVNDIIKALSNGDLKLHEAIELKKKVENLKEEEPEIEFNEEVKLGDYVSVPHLNIEGKVDRLKSNKAHIVTNEGLGFDIEISKLHVIDKPKNNVSVKSKQKNYEDKINTSVGLELNIIGMHRDEAKDALIKYLDSCKVKNLKQVRIIHGFGSGVLRKMVHEYLDTLKGVKYRLGDINEGGGGATVVILHD